MTRQYKILEYVAEQPHITVKELAQYLEVSEVTIRKDLTALENDRLLKRTHGGVTLLNPDSMEAKMAHNYLAKLAIAKAAAALVQPGDTILVDAGSTNAVFAKELLHKQNVHVITNSLYIANILVDAPSLQVTLIGGTLQRHSQTFAGPIAKYVLDKISVQKAFLATNGFSERLGFTCNDFSQVEIGALMAEHAQSVYILADADKFTSVGTTTIVPLAQVDAVITNQGVATHALDLLARANIQVTQV
jgi:DeoR/GlpR family transcriptional regulator of sugar metabolism